jgi:hypothetical protein
MCALRYVEARWRYHCRGKLMRNTHSECVSRASSCMQCACAPFDYHLFGFVKNQMRGQHYETSEALQIRSVL